MSKPTTDVQVVEAAGAITPDQTRWTPEQQAALEAIGVGNAPAAQQALFLRECQRTGLDPWARQIYMLERRSKNKQGAWETKWTIQTGIDGLRLVAERSGRLAGVGAPQWCGEDGVWRDVWTSKDKPAAAKVEVWRADKAMPYVGVCLFEEFKQDNHMWNTKSAHMIAKCAEAQALRKAFPQDLSGLHIPEELTPDQERRPVNTARLHPKPATLERVDTTTGEITTVPDRDQALALIGALFEEAGITDHDQRLLWVNQELALADLLDGTPVEAATDLTPAQADEVITRLQAHIDQTITEQMGEHG